MPRSAGRLERIREESRDRILASALRLFARRGYDATSIRMIATEAGISQGLLYNYFRGKQDVLRAIFERSMEDVRASFRGAAGAPTAGRGVEALVRGALAIVHEHRDFWRLSYQIRMQPEVVAGLGDETRAWAAEISARIERLLRAAGADQPAVAARLLFAAVDGVAQHYVLDPEGYPLDEVVAEMLRRLVPAP